MSKVNFIRCNNTNLDTVPVNDGQIIYTKDTNMQYLDIDNKRYKVSSIVFIENENVNIDNPSEDKLYYSVETNEVFRYDTDKLVKLNIKTNADSVDFNNTNTDLKSNNVQYAIIEIDTKKVDLLENRNDVLYATDDKGNTTYVNKDYFVKSEDYRTFKNDIEKTVEDDKSELSTSIKTHIEDTNNPHNVTKKQLDIENIDNTSDLDKPISTLTQEALDLKQAIIDENLQTDAKTIVEAINELVEKINDLNETILKLSSQETDNTDVDTETGNTETETDVNEDNTSETENQ